MVNQKAAMDRLNREREYEDHLSDVLASYFLQCLDDIDDISGPEKEKMREHLNTIRNETVRHRARFNQLLQMVLENGEDTY